MSSRYGSGTSATVLANMSNSRWENAWNSAMA